MWTLTSQAAQFIMQSVSTVVLARLLTPADFGLVAMVTAISGLGQAFADLGLSEATIQSPEVDHQQVSTLFWINVAIGLSLTLIMVALTPVIVWFYHEPRLKPITLLVSLTFVIGGLRVQHDALLRRQMRFASLAIRDVIAYLIAVPLAIVLAWKGYGYWALVVLPLTLNSTQMLLSWVLVRWIPGLPRRAAGIRSMLVFGSRVAGSYLILNINQNADNVLIGWYWGANPLGLYSRAYNLLMLPVKQLGIPARGVAVPVFSRVQNDPERLTRYYLRAVNLIIWISAPLFGYLFVAARPIIILTLGYRWRGAAPVFQMLAIFALGQLLLDSILWLFIGRGESHRLFKLLLTISPIIVASYMLGLPFGIKGVALSGSLMLLAIFPWVLKYSFQGTELTLAALGRSIACPTATCLAGIAVSEIVLKATKPGSIGLQLAMAAAGCALGWVASMVFPQIRKEVMALKVLFTKSRLSGLRQMGEDAA